MVVCAESASSWYRQIAQASNETVTKVDPLNKDNIAHVVKNEPAIFVVLSRNITCPLVRSQLFAMQRTFHRNLELLLGTPKKQFR